MVKDPVRAPAYCPVAGGVGIGALSRTLSAAPGSNGLVAALNRGAGTTGVDCPGGSGAAHAVPAADSQVRRAARVISTVRDIR